MAREKLVCRSRRKVPCFGLGGGKQPPQSKAKEISHAYPVHDPRSGPAPCPAISGRGAQSAKGEARRRPATAPAQGDEAVLSQHGSRTEECSREAIRSGAAWLRL